MSILNHPFLAALTLAGFIYLAALSQPLQQGYDVSVFKVLDKPQTRSKPLSNGNKAELMGLFNITEGEIGQPIHLFGAE